MVKFLTSVDASSVSTSQIKENGTMIKDSIPRTSAPTEKSPADAEEGCGCLWENKEGVRKEIQGSCEADETNPRAAVVDSFNLFVSWCIVNIQ
uniref:Uncharacterized protein n=1 Tax=Ditylenchus dipsaci TaxID=166011 RepID=A0A915DZ60_9BILA